jgi:hypothetical protein
VKILLHGLNDESGFGFVTRGIRDAISSEYLVVMWDAMDACRLSAGMHPVKIFCSPLDKLRTIVYIIA